MEMGSSESKNKLHFTLVRHGGVVVSTLASKLERPGFESTSRQDACLCEVCVSTWVFFGYSQSLSVLWLPPRA